MSDKDYQRWTETVITQLTDAERAVDAVLKDFSSSPTSNNPGRTGSAPLGHAASAGPPSSTGAPSTVAAPASTVVVEGPDAAYLADAMADELRDRLRQLAKQVAEMQSTMIIKEATIAQLVQQKAELEARFGKTIKDRKAGESEGGCPVFGVRRRVAVCKYVDDAPVTLCVCRRQVLHGIKHRSIKWIPNVLCLPTAWLCDRLCAPSGL